MLPIALVFGQKRQLGDLQVTRTERVADAIHQRPKTHFQPERNQIGDRIDLFAPRSHRLLAFVRYRLVQPLPNHLSELRVVGRSDQRRRSQRGHRFEVLTNVLLQLLLRAAVQSFLVDEVCSVDRRCLQRGRALNRQRRQNLVRQNRPVSRCDRLQNLQFLVKSIRIQRKRGVWLIGIPQKQFARRSERRRERQRGRIHRKTVQNRHKGVVEIAEKLLMERPRRGRKNQRRARACADFAGGGWRNGGSQVGGGDLVVVVDESCGYRARIVELLSHPVFHTAVFVEDDERNVREKTDVAASHLHIERLSRENVETLKESTRNLEVRKTKC